MTRIAIALLAAILLLPTTPARADAIDGDWCSRDGRNLSIRGPEITTPGGTRMQADYDRHHFHYVVPAAEPGAGQHVFMTLRGDHLVHLRMAADAQAAAAAPVQEWRRCAPATS